MTSRVQHLVKNMISCSESLSRSFAQSQAMSSDSDLVSLNPPPKQTDLSAPWGNDMGEWTHSNASLQSQAHLGWTLSCLEPPTCWPCSPFSCTLNSIFPCPSSATCQWWPSATLLEKSPRWGHCSSWIIRPSYSYGGPRTSSQSLLWRPSSCNIAICDPPLCITWQWWFQGFLWPGWYLLSCGSG